MVFCKKTLTYYLETDEEKKQTHQLRFVLQVGLNVSSCH